jgi:transcriptional regulator with XRE-family HTH domain
MRPNSPHVKAPTPADLGRAIRRLRRARELTIEALAHTADLHPTYLSGIERGVRNPTWIKICNLTNALGVSISALAQDSETEAHIDARTKQIRSELRYRTDGGAQAAQDGS